MGLIHVWYSKLSLNSNKPSKSEFVRPANLVKAVLDDTAKYVGLLENGRHGVEVSMIAGYLGMMYVGYLQDTSQG